MTLERPSLVCRAGHGQQILWPPHVILTHCCFTADLGAAKAGHDLVIKHWRQCIGFITNKDRTAFYLEGKLNREQLAVLQLCGRGA